MDISTLIAPFDPGKTYIPASGKVFGQEEIDNAKQAAEDKWWTEGRFAKKFETEFSKFTGLKRISLVNSGSSANLVAVAALTSKVFKDRALQPGDEFITVATGFPTTINPGIIHGLSPVFIDVDPKTLNIKVEDIERAITPKTKLIMVAHTLGNPFNLSVITKLAHKHNLWIIEDCCDALGSEYDDQLVGTFGDIATFSFYPAHQITMGEGGAVATNNPLIHKSIRQFRDWGRDCWCDTGHDNTCKKRFSWKLGELPYGYDHKFIYSQIGYNLKLSDFQPAIGVAQLKRVKTFIKIRRKNYQALYKFFSQYPQFFDLLETDPKSNPSWFGFPLFVKATAPFSRNDFTEYLEKNKIGTRNVFAGNLLRHPAYCDKNYKTIGTMKNADLVMNQACWVGVFPGIDQVRLDYMKQTINSFLKKYI